MKVNQIRSQAGFTLIEAMVALIVLGFGMLALAGMQATLSRNADVAKQRTEAMRLAQDKMEGLRSFTGLTADATYVDWTDLGSGTDQISSYVLSGTTLGSTNTTFTRRWTLGGASTDSQRAINVSVSWTDRSGDTQSINLASVVARVDPKDAGVLAYPLPENTNLKRPKNRNLNIPIQAIPLSGGKSAYKLPAGFSIVFSDVTGYVVEKCDTTSITDTTYADASWRAAHCTTYDAFILAGYVSGDSGVVTNNSSGVATMPSGVNVYGVTDWDNSNNKQISCSYGQARDQNKAADDPTGLIPNYQYYICVIPVRANGGTWSGTVRLGGVSVGSNYKVCRFQYAASEFINDNERNLQPYSNVNESLDNQNYYIRSSNDGNCPTVGVSITGVSGGTVATQLHQDCRSGQSPGTGANDACPAAAYNAAASSP